MRTIFLLTFLCLSFLWLPRCSNQIVSGPEVLHAPVNLKIEAKTSPFTYYHLEFQSDNRETGFGGYRLFTGATADEANAAVSAFTDSGSYPDVADGATCPSSAFSDFQTPVTIQVGGSSDITGYSCVLKSLALASNQYVAVRAFAVRRDNTFSEAATVLVP